MKKGCAAFQEFIDAQLAEMRAAVDEDKWYLSEREGRDIGLVAAKRHFQDHYFMEFVKKFRGNFCKTRCSLREECPGRD